MVFGNLTREELESVADEAVTILSKLYQIYATSDDQEDFKQKSEELLYDEVFPILLKYSAEYQDNG